MVSEKIFARYIEQEISEAYHGTDYDSAVKIKETQKFLPSRDSNCFLGDGIYFFENSQGHAEDWAKNRKINNYAILQARVLLGECLDLNNFEGKKAMRTMAMKLKLRGIRTINDAAVINALAQWGNIDTVRATYCQPDKKYLFEGSRFFDYTAQYLCVRKSNKISKIELISSGVV